MKDFVFVANHDGTILFMNKEGSVLDEFGSKIESKNIFDYLSNGSKEEVLDKINAAIQKCSHSIEIEPVHFLVNNSCHLAALKLQFFYNNKNLSIIAGNLKCIDPDNDMMDYYKQLYLDFIDNLPLGVYRTGARGAIHYVNKKFADILGYKSAEELYEKNILDFIVNAEQREAKLKDLTDGRIQAIEVQMQKTNEKVVWVKDSGRIIRDSEGKVLFIDGILEDITQQKEDGIKLKEINASKDKLFSIISHDLRTPFNQFIGATELLLTKLDEYDKVMIRKFLTLLNKEATQSYRLLENLLQWSKNQRGLLTFNPEPINVSDLIEKLLLIYEPIAESKNIIIDLEVPSSLHVYADNNMLSTILRNLVSNALKFTQKGGSVIVSVVEKVDEENMFSEYIEVCVADTGVGIPEESIPNLFSIHNDSVVKAEYTESGTGIGLVLCKEFVEKHNGKIWVESEYGKGSAFYFTIQ